MFRAVSASRLLFATAVLALASVQIRELNADDWPEWRGRGRLGVWNETGILDRFAPDGLLVRWRTPINAGYSGPSVTGGRVFVTDSRRIRGNRAMERALALDETTGKVLWTHEWEADYTGLQLIYAIGPRATPTVDGDRVYVLGAMGRLVALESASGRVVWQKDFVSDFGAQVPSWGMAAAPLVDGDRLICLVGGEPNAKVMAFNKHTGAEIWRALSSDWEPGYNQPTIIEAAGTRQLIIWHPRAVSALDPVSGKIYWEVPSEVDMGMTVATPVQSGPHLLVTSFYNGARMIALDDRRPAARLLWSSKSNSEVETDAIHSTISTPVIEGQYIYGIDSHGELRCLELLTGRRVWESMALTKERARWATAFFVKQGDRYFINNDRGELVIARLSPQGYQEISRTKLIEPTHPYARRRELGAVHWSHPAYANRHIFVRNDTEILKASLEKDRQSEEVRRDGVARH
jgi:outer membrane protein assembly factor BamB